MPTRPFLLRAAVLATLIASANVSACGDRAPDAALDAPAPGAVGAPDTPAADASTSDASASATATGPATGPRGKYGCIQTVPRMVGGSYEYEIEQRGFITLANGRYTDPFQVSGTYRHDAATDSTFFTGGILDGANATPMERGRLWVVIPVAGGRENRWTCGPA